MNLLRPTLLALACLALPAGASDLPSLGDASSSIVSPEQEHRLGRAWLSVLRGQIDQLSDPQLKDYVETSVYRLAETSQLEDRRLNSSCSTACRSTPSRPRRHRRSQRRPAAARPDRGRIRLGDGSRTGAPVATPLRPRCRGPATHAGTGDGRHARRHRCCRCRRRRRRYRHHHGCAGRRHPGAAPLLPPERTGSRPHRPAQPGESRLRSARHAQHVRAPDAPVSLRLQAAGIPPHPPGHRIAHRRYPQPRRAVPLPGYLRQPRLPADACAHPADV